MRKALCIGIDFYGNDNDLTGCINDARLVSDSLKTNYDGSKNFNVKSLYGSENESVSFEYMLESIRELFCSYCEDCDVVLFYFSGHGYFDRNDAYLCASDTNVNNIANAIPFNSVLDIVNESKAKNKIIILDCCFSGAMGYSKDGNFSYSKISDGTIILTASSKEQASIECDGKGLFTSLFVEALNGASMNILGEVSPGSIYAYIDKALGPWEQRPIFKANVRNFISLKKNKPLIELEELKKIVTIFESKDKLYQLDPSYEPDKSNLQDKTVNKDNENIFKILQNYTRLGLVIPDGEEHMYYAAINSKHCKLTELGKSYWTLIKKERI